MSKSSAKGWRKTYDLIYRMKVKQRNDIVKCLLITVVAIIAVFGDQLLTMRGYIDSESVVHSAVMMMVVFGLAIFGGSASIDYTKQKNKILELQRETGITDVDIKTFMRS